MYNILEAPTLFKRYTNKVMPAEFIMLYWSLLLNPFQSKEKRCTCRWAEEFKQDFWKTIVPNQILERCCQEFVHSVPAARCRFFHVETGLGQPPVLHQAFLQNNYDTHNTLFPQTPSTLLHQCIIHKQLIAKAKSIASTLTESAAQRPQQHKRTVSPMTDYFTIFVS